VSFIAAALLLVPASVCAQIRMEERDGVLYVNNVDVAAVAWRVTAGAVTAADSYRPLIRDAADRHAVAPALVESVIRVESNFQPRAVSRKGARGLMQLMPETAARLGVRNIFDAQENIEAGVRHLRYLMDRYQGNTSLALAAYNAGVDAVARYGGIPPYAETRAYVTRILTLVQQAGPVGGQSPIAARALYRYEGRDGRVVYSNLPIERLSSATRDILEGRE
jgi:soluble lytic murein transglycosylase-like protein